MRFWQESYPTLMLEKHATSVLSGWPEMISNGERQVDEARNIPPGDLKPEEDAAGGLGRHLGLFSTTLLMLVHSPEYTLQRWLTSTLL